MNKLSVKVKVSSLIAQLSGMNPHSEIGITLDVPVYAPEEVAPAKLSSPSEGFRLYSSYDRPFIDIAVLFDDVVFTVKSFTNKTVIYQGVSEKHRSVITLFTYLNEGELVSASTEKSIYDVKIKVLEVNSADHEGKAIVAWVNHHLDNKKKMGRPTFREVKSRNNTMLVYGIQFE